MSYFRLPFLASNKSTKGSHVYKSHRFRIGQDVYLPDGFLPNGEAKPWRKAFVTECITKKDGRMFYAVLRYGEVEREEVVPEYIPRSREQ